MSGKRCKAMRREFRERWGCAPAGAHTKQHLRNGRFMGKVFSFFQMEVLAPSEWRQTKKAYLARRAA